VERQQDVLRVEPHMLPELRRSFGDALAELHESLVGLQRSGYLPSAWLGDEESRAVAAHYTSRAMNEPDSSYQALLAYRDELARVHNTLQRMEDEYLGTDHQASADLRRRA
jgi:hypothetical protein